MENKIIALLFCVLLFTNAASMERPVPSLKAQALKTIAQLPVEKLKPKLQVIPQHFYAEIAQEIILKNKKLSMWQMKDMVNTMIGLLHKAGFGPQSEQIILLQSLAFALIGNKQVLLETIDKAPVNIYPTMAYAMIFKNEFLSIEDIIALLKQMLTKLPSKDTPDYKIIVFFADFLEAFRGYLHDKRNMLIENGINTVIGAHEAGMLSNTILQGALRSEPVVIHFLLEQGADPNLTVEESIRPISVAAHLGNLAILQDLIAHGAQIQPREQYRTPFYDPLFEAAASGQVDALQFLFDMGGNVNLIFHTYDWGYDTLLGQIKSMIEEAPYNVEDLQRAYNLLRKYGAKTLDEFEKEKESNKP